MNNELDEMFSMLTFFKICRTYQVLKKQKLNSRKGHCKLPGLTRVSQRSEPKRNFSMFSKACKESPRFKNKVRYGQAESEAIRSHHNNESTVKYLQVLKGSPPREEKYASEEQKQQSTQPQVAKEEISISEWQMSEHQLPSNTMDTGQSHGKLDENIDIVETIYDQINDNDLKHDGEETAVETQHISDQDETDLAIALVFNDVDIAASIEPPLPEVETLAPVRVKKRRRRRRPGDPPLSPLRKEKKKVQRRYRVRPENRNRSRESYFCTVFKNKKKDESQFLQLVRMTLKSYSSLLKVIYMPMQIKRQNVMTEERLAITLLHLAHGMTFQTLSEKFQVGKTTVRFVVLQTCEVIWDVLSPIYMRDPTSEDYVQISEGFKKQLNLPNCAGVLGTRRVPFVAPRKVTTYKFRQIKDLVLMTICDWKHIFRQTTITVEPHHSQLFRDIINSAIPLPPGKPLDDDSSSCDFPYYFIGNKAFPQRPNLMSPYTNDSESETNIIYNNSISWGQSISDTAFDILTSMWRVLLSNEGFSIENWETVIKACVVLHNFVLINDKKLWYQSNGSIKKNWPDNITTEVLSDWQDEKYPVAYLTHLEAAQTSGSVSNKSGEEAREMLSDYFCIEEMVPDLGK